MCWNRIKGLPRCICSSSEAVFDGVTCRIICRIHVSKEGAVNFLSSCKIAKRLMNVVDTSFEERL